MGWTLPRELGCLETAVVGHRERLGSHQQLTDATRAETGTDRAEVVVGTAVL